MRVELRGSYPEPRPCVEHAMEDLVRREAAKLFDEGKLTRWGDLPGDGISLN